MAVTEDNVKERFAREIHNIWSHWTQYMFQVELVDIGDSYRLSNKTAERWQRQMDTPYSELTETEKDSDRKQVEKLWPLIVALIRQAEVDAVEEFAKQVDQRAQSKMAMTGKLEGSHYAAMQELLREWEWYR